MSDCSCTYDWALLDDKSKNALLKYQTNYMQPDLHLFSATFKMNIFGQMFLSIDILKNIIVR